MLLLILWFLQTIFLSGFYEFIKTNELQTALATVEKNFSNATLKDNIDEITKKNQIYVEIIDTSMATNFIFDKYERIPNSFDFLDRLYLFIQTEENGGFLKANLEEKPTYKIGGNHPTFFSQQKSFGRGIVLSKIIEDKNQNKLMIIMYSAITPVNAVVDTLKIQLFFVTIAMVILSSLIALFIAKWISKPIVSISESAKEFAKGNYDTEFNASGYKEITELSDIMNYSAKELSKVENLRRELIANISHDLRTPLTLITGYAEVMRDLPEENNPENAQVIIDESKRLTSLVQDVLDLSKLQQGQENINPVEFNITADINEVINRFSEFKKSMGYSIEFVYDNEVTVFADEVKISQAFYNLLINAINYTGEDKKVIVYQKIIDDSVKIEVVDTGAGVDEEELEHIWERYYSGKSNHVRAKTGSGIGLSLVKTIIEKHRGDCGVISKKDEGSCFWFSLKLKE